jgi:hypothetical protein
MNKHTPGPWTYEYSNDTGPDDDCFFEFYEVSANGTLVGRIENESDARLTAVAPELLEALHEGRRAIGDHFAPGDCYATGPMTGDPIRDLVQCPACSFIATYDAVIAKARGEA